MAMILLHRDGNDVWVDADRVVMIHANTNRIGGSRVVVTASTLITATCGTIDVFADESPADVAAAVNDDGATMKLRAVGFVR